MKKTMLVLFIFNFLFSGESIATYQVDGMMCALNCPKKVNESLNGIEGIKSCKVDFATKTATIVYDDEMIGPDKIKTAIIKGTYYKVKNLNDKERSKSFWNWLLGNN